MMCIAVISNAQFNVAGSYNDYYGRTNQTVLQDVKAIGIGNFSSAPQAAFHINTNLLTTTTMYTPGHVFRTDGPSSSDNIWEMWTGSGAGATQKGAIVSPANSNDFYLRASLPGASLHFQTQYNYGGPITRMIITDGGWGYVGIGPGFTAPQSLLHLNGTTAPVYLQISNYSIGSTAANGFKIGISTTGVAELRQQQNMSMRFYTNNIQRMMIDSLGKVGIGTANPFQKLVVSGSARITDTTYLNTTPQAGIDTVNYKILVKNQTTNKVYQMWCKGIIGATGPTGATGAQGIQGATGATGTFNGTSVDSLHVLNKVKVGNSIYLDASTGGIPNNIYTDDADLLIQSNNSKSYNYNTILNANLNVGKVGIGTTTPGLNYENPGALKLDVAGHARFSSSTNQEDYVRIGNNGANALIDNYGTGKLLINYYSGKDVVIGNYNSTNHTAAGSLTIQNKLGLGIEAASDPTIKLHIKNYSNYCTTCPATEDDFSTASAKIRIEDEVYGDMTRDAWWDITASSANQKLYITSQTSGSNVIHKVMTMTESGRVGIGTYSPFAELEIASTTGSYSGNTLPIVRNTGNFGAGWHFIPGGSAEEWYVHATGPSNSQGANKFVFKISDSSNVMVLSADGKVGIGTDLSNTTGYDDFKFFVNGKILCEKIKVISAVAGADYVFNKNYSLKSLKEVEKYITENNHLPEIPSAEDMKKNGLDLTEMNILLLKKVEELTLYLIEQNKQIDELKKSNEIFKDKLGIK